MSKAKKQKRYKLWAAKLHLWLGLTSGLVVFIVAVTGCIFVFHDEIRDLTQDWRKIEPREQEFVPPSLLQKEVKEHFPGADVSMVVYQDRERPAHIATFLEGTLHNIYLDPYTGEIIHIQNTEKDFFLIIEDLHMHLMLPEEVGKQVVGISTIIFIIMLITGIILWWPKKRKNLKKHLTIKWKARWRRVNYDWHRTTGLYVTILGLLLAITGLSFSYEWMHSTFYQIGNLGQEYPADFISLKISEEAEDSGVPVVDKAMAQTFAIYPQSGMFFVWDQGKDLPTITGAYPEALHFDHQSNFYFHPVSGDLLQEHFYRDKSNGLKLQEMSYGLHTGQYFGLGGKILVFLGSFFIAGLPVSGFLLWWGRRNKQI
ncbi:Uncharacterized iron-regulated membrane protein [Salinimicrobium catena]|uniref:Uncharacterized iron-regulated membrane protein n=1 Tax=Salinimicrobium catena TaxID=390640 RepID=A0A1H5MWK3_9FLAO|nr:PepSY-associated TM helix domain-containing protein [Salinimicrobium catena]SDL30015.1 Uncharacterized iron-regulated membrane protein [Salinimicrobium catena]SEE93011.1 Uncharacterized iron-regulated membrane protein [Salinimicrobium catena]